MSIMDKVAEAKKAVKPISPAELTELKKGGGKLLVVDVRDSAEVAQSGKVEGAVNVSRGMLEFKADAASPYHDAAFDKDATVVVYCASGGRAALAGQVLQEMGFADVRTLGTFKEWAESGGAIEGKPGTDKA